MHRKGISGDHHLKVLSIFWYGIRKSFMLFFLPMMLTACSGNTNSTGPAPPLPTGQGGALTLWTITNAGCYVSDNAPCSSTSPGSNPITAVGAFSTASPPPTSASSSNYLVTGDGAGNVTAWTVPDSSSSNPSSSVACSGTVVASVQGVAATYNNSSTVVYFVSAGVLYANSSSTPCSGGSSPPIATTGSVVGLTVADGYIYGVSSGGKYFSIPAGSISSSSLSSPSSLPNLPSTAVIGGVTADLNGIVYVTDYANSAIYAYYANNNGTLTRINGTLSGNVDVTNPKAITTVYAPLGTSSGCSNTGPCEFLYVTNYAQAIVQLVLSVNGSGQSTSVGYTEFNAPYTDCEIINPLSMASFVNVDSTTNPLQSPWVFIGQNGTVSGKCQGFTSVTTFGNGVTAYNLTP